MGVPWPSAGTDRELRTERGLPLWLPKFFIYPFNSSAGWTGAWPVSLPHRPGGWPA